MDVLVGIVFFFLIACPYLILFIKNVDICIKLVFVSLAEILVVCILSLTIYFTGSSLIIAYLFSFNIFVWIIVIINIFAILLICINKKLKAYTKKKHSLNH